MAGSLRTWSELSQSGLDGCTGGNQESRRLLSCFSLTLFEWLKVLMDGPAEWRRVVFLRP